jgi:hypothetical protein
MGGYQEAEVIDPFKLLIGDQIACHEAGRGLAVLTGAGVDGEHGLDEIWRSLLNEPAKTDMIHGWPVPGGNVALQFGEQEWTVSVLPTVLARRRLRPGQS